MNTAFFGTPDLAVFVLEELLYASVTPDLIVTAPDKPAGRKLTLAPPAVKVWAQEHDLPIIQAASLRSPDDVPELANTEWDLFIVAAYNIILPAWLLDAPKHRVLNVHPSLLPKLRGPSPIRSAILRDEQDAVGVTVIELDEKVDHGPIVAQARVELPKWPVQGRVLDEILFREGGRLLAEVLPSYLKGNIKPEEQNHARATFSKKFSKADGEIDLTDDGYENFLKYCAMDGWPGTFYFTDQDERHMRVKITEATYTDGEFRILKVVPEGKREMEYEEYMRTR